MLQVWAKSSFARASCDLKRPCRSMSSPKSILCASKSGPSTQANLISPSTVTRHEPHIPVPSTMIAFRLTAVGTPRGRVTSVQAFIIGSGPIAHDLVDLFARENVLERGGDEPGPAVGAVVRADDQLVAVLPEAVLPEDEILRAEADDPRDAVAGLLEGPELRETRERRRGRLPRARRDRRSSRGSACRGARRSRETCRLPGRSAIISRVVLPTAWMTIVTVPQSRS